MDSVLVKLENSLKILQEIFDQARHTRQWGVFNQRFDRWQKRTGKIIEEVFSSEEFKKFNDVTFMQSIYMGGRSPGESETELVNDNKEYLEILIETVKDYPEDFIQNKTSTEEDKTESTKKLVPNKNTIFIVHGHDLASALSLEKYLEKEKGLRPIILQDQPSEGKVLIDKFEGKADSSSFIFVVFSPDDEVVGKEVKGKKQPNYQQPRPNVFFEMGWFYGKVGRERVRIIKGEGANIPSDLEGITRIDYHKDISQAFHKIEGELRAAGLIK